MSEHQSFSQLVNGYNKTRDKRLGEQILTKLLETTRNTFRYLISRNFTGVTAAFIVKSEAVFATANACFIALTEESFIEGFQLFKKKREAVAPQPQVTGDEELFQKYVGNLAARVIYRLSRDEFSEFSLLFSRKRTMQYIENKKDLYNRSNISGTAEGRGMTAPELFGGILEGDMHPHVLDESNSFVMQAFTMIRNPSYREILRRYDLEAVPLTEIAEEMNKEYPLIRQWHKRALRELKNNLEEILKGKWGVCYFRALERIRDSYASLDGTYAFRLRLLDLNLQGKTIRESVDLLVKDGILPYPDSILVKRQNSPQENLISWIKGIPFMEERLLNDNHFRDSFYQEARKENTDGGLVGYIYQQVARFQLQQILWHLYETFKELAEEMPREK
ncbi:MAG: hypothetical protein RDV48_26505 [Candidatus Eremiobacteraeota bacterium]|nr:hypothetical protein [Candidatus Eremiobacteraeota bacterium]